MTFKTITVKSYGEKNIIIITRVCLFKENKTLSPYFGVLKCSKKSMNKLIFKKKKYVPFCNFLDFVDWFHRKNMLKFLSISYAYSESFVLGA